MNRCEVIAELGINWLGDFGLAKEMIEAAAASGCDYVKTQTWQSKKVRKGPWESEIEIYEKAQLNTPGKHEKLMRICDDNKIKYLTTLFDPEDYALIPLSLDCVKIAGIEADNQPLLDLCSSKFKTIFVSTCGLSDKQISGLDYQLHMNHIFRNPISYTLMYGVYMYPCPIRQSGMQRFVSLRTAYNGFGFGYSDHTQGPWASLFAISHGATVVERHFTIDNNLPGIDNKFSCLPQEMKIVCDFRDNMEPMLCSDAPDESFILDNFKGRWSGK